MEVAKNIFKDGLVCDLAPESTGSSSLSYMLNGTLLTYNGNEFSLQNDMGNVKIEDAHLPEGFIPVGAKEHGGIIYVASYNPETKECLLGSFPSPKRDWNGSETSSTKPLSLPENLYMQLDTLIIDQILYPGDKFCVEYPEDYETLSKFIDFDIAILLENNILVYLKNVVFSPPNSQGFPNIIQEKYSGKIVLITKFKVPEYIIPNIKKTTNSKNIFTVTIPKEYDAKLIYKLNDEFVENNSEIDVLNNKVTIIPYIDFGLTKDKLDEYFKERPKYNINDTWYLAITEKITVLGKNLEGLVVWNYNKDELNFSINFEESANRKISIYAYPQTIDGKTINIEDYTTIYTEELELDTISEKLDISDMLSPNTLYFVKIEVEQESKKTTYNKWLYTIDNLFDTTLADYSSLKLENVYTLVIGNPEFVVSSYITYDIKEENKLIIYNHSNFTTTQTVELNIKHDIFKSVIEEGLRDLFNITNNLILQEFAVDFVYNSGYLNNSKSATIINLISTTTNPYLYLNWSNNCNELGLFTQELYSNNEILVIDPDKGIGKIYKLIKYNYKFILDNSASSNYVHNENKNIIDIITDAYKDVYTGGKIFVPYIIHDFATIDSETIDLNLTQLKAIRVGIAMMTSDKKYVPINFVANCSLDDGEENLLTKFPYITNNLNFNVFTIVRNFIYQLYGRIDTNKTVQIPEVNGNSLEYCTIKADSIKIKDSEIDINNIIIPKYNSYSTELNFTQTYKDDTIISNINNEEIGRNSLPDILIKLLNGNYNPNIIKPEEYSSTLYFKTANEKSCTGITFPMSGPSSLKIYWHSNIKDDSLNNVEKDNIIDTNVNYNIGNYLAFNLENSEEELINMITLKKLDDIPNNALEQSSEGITYLKYGIIHKDFKF